MLRKAGVEGLPVRSMARNATVEMPSGGSITVVNVVLLAAWGCGVAHFCQGEPLMLISIEVTA